MKIPNELRLVETEPGSVELAEGDDVVGRAFRMRGYSGAEIRHPFIGKFIIDLAGMTLGRTRKPILMEHDRGARVGFSESIDKGDDLTLSGKLVGTPAAEEFASLSDDGFPWESSIGFRIDRVEEIAEGDTKRVNGREFTGPGLVLSKTRLRESSVVTLGADDDTSSRALSEVPDATWIETNSKEAEMSQKDPKQPNGPGKDPIDIEQVRQEAREEASAQSRQLLTKLREEFPKHETFALECFEKGMSVEEAKVAHRDVLQTENDELRTKLAARGGLPGAPAPAGSASEGADPVETPSAEEVDAEASEPRDTELSVEDRAKRELAKDKELRDEFGGDEKLYAAYLRSTEDGRLKIKGA